MAQSEVESDEELENPVHHIQVESCTLGLTPLFCFFFAIYNNAGLHHTHKKTNKQYTHRNPAWNIILGPPM